MQLIFDESQKDGVNQIWIDVYHIVKLLAAEQIRCEKRPGSQRLFQGIQND